MSGRVSHVTVTLGGDVFAITETIMNSVVCPAATHIQTHGGADEARGFWLAMVYTSLGQAQSIGIDPAQLAAEALAILSDARRLQGH